MQHREPFQIQLIVLSDGERLSMLVDGTGMPIYFPALFITTQVRNAGRSANTISAYLSAIKRLYLWAHASGIDLERRLSTRAYFTDPELESLSSSIGRRIRSRTVISFDLAELKHRRARANIRKGQILSHGKYRNLTYIGIYLRWLAARLTERAAGMVDQLARGAIKDMAEAIEAKRPRRARRAIVSAPKGLEHAEESLLLNFVSEQAFRASACRNELIVHLLIKLGLRAGELLALRVSDFDLQRNEVLIARRPDDEADGRRHQPTAKTCDRLLPISNELARLVQRYVIKHRRAARGAKRHPFLIVVHKEGPHEGSELTASGLAKIFLKSTFPRF